MKPIVMLVSLLMTPGMLLASDGNDLLAKGHFVKGVDLYNMGHYDEALIEFQAARHAHALPAFDFNIAQCLDHMGRRAAAAVAFRRYLASNLPAREAAQVQERIKVLESAEPMPLLPVPTTALKLTELDVPKPMKPRRRLLAPLVLSAGAVAIAVVGVGLLGSASADYNSLKNRCAPFCQPTTWAGIPEREHAGEAMLGVAGGAAVAGIVLWIVEVRK